ncbi:MAG: glycosyltransferase family 39 protein, partial [Armatimonadetes bacterium]|nr:glycosyltransferase family 39 protein [Armatimonadota bacterium]
MWTRRFLPAAIAVYLLLAGAYTHYLPPGQAPDEHAHFEYVLFLAREGRLPRYGVDDVGYESYQAPLYYTLSAAVCKLAMLTAGRGEDEPPREPPSAEELLRRFPRNSLVPRAQFDLAVNAARWAADLTPAERAGWRAVRWFTILLGALGILLAHRIVFIIAPARPWLAGMAAAGIACLPMYAHICAAVGNDPPSVVVLGAVALMILLVLRDGATPRRVGWLGVFLGLAMLTKDSANVGLPVAVLAVALAVGKQ